MKVKTAKIIAALLAIALMLSVAACGGGGSQQQSQSQPQQQQGAAMGATDGTYTSTVQAYGGDMTVQVVIASGNISSIEVLEHNETPGIYNTAFERIPAAVMAGPTLNVDAVAGATVSSNALIKAITDCLRQAGMDINALMAASGAAAGGGEHIEKTVDVVVIGGGGAGLAAAVAASQNGASVIVLEKMPRLGGNTIIAGGAFNAVNPTLQAEFGVEDSTDLHFTQTYEAGDKEGNPALIRMLVDNALAAREWLTDLGMGWAHDVFTVTGGLHRRANRPADPVGTGFINTLGGYIERPDSNIELMLDTKAEELIIDGGRVVGVKATTVAGDTVTLTATNGVVLATGGFGVNVEMRMKYDTQWNKLGPNILSTNHPGATGDGIIMAEAVDANLVGMGYIQLLSHGDPVTGSLSGNIETSVEERIFVNKEGKRFVAEDARRDVMTAALFEQTDSLMYIIMDSKEYPTGDEKNNFNETPNQLVEAGRAFRGDTIAELAAQINMDPAALQATIDEYNKAVEAGTDEFGRTQFGQKIDQGPFYAGPRIPTVHHTMGGLEINEICQVINTSGNVIPGLYAAGEVAGGIHGTNRVGGNALADIIVFGRIAGESVALKK